MLSLASCVHQSPDSMAMKHAEECNVPLETTSTHDNGNGLKQRHFGFSMMSCRLTPRAQRDSTMTASLCVNRSTRATEAPQTAVSFLNGAQQVGFLCSLKSIVALREVTRATYTPFFVTYTSLRCRALAAFGDSVSHCSTLKQARSFFLAINPPSLGQCSPPSSSHGRDKLKSS